MLPCFGFLCMFLFLLLVPTLWLTFELLSKHVKASIKSSYYLFPFVFHCIHFVFSCLPVIEKRSNN
jgi:hypothetical protein